MPSDGDILHSSAASGPRARRDPRPLVLTLGALLLAPSPILAAASRPPAAVLAPILKDIRDQGHPLRQTPAAMFRAVDVNGDGVADWIADFSRSGEGAWCGTGGCRQVIFVSGAGGRYEVAFDEQTRELKLGRRSGVLRLDVEVHGSTCGSYGESECRRGFVWDPARSEFVEAMNRNGGTRLRLMLLQNVHAPAPAPVRDGFAGLTRRCASAGGKPDAGEPSLASVPDLNGDGSRDWIAEPPDCEMPGAAQAPKPEFLVFLSGPGGYRRALSFSATTYDIDIATRPARIVEHLGECGMNGACGAERTLTWDARDAAFRASPSANAGGSRHKAAMTARAQVRER